MTDLWPGFAPEDYPVAVYDGVRTRLFRHPSPPAEFGMDPDEGRVHAVTGRHPAVVANTVVELGGVPTATILSGSSDVHATIAHETFHLYCGSRHPEWAANEAVTLSYPADDVEVLTLRRLEAEALRRALDRASAAWAAAAVGFKQRRFERLSSPLIGYERDLERWEGIAFYVEGKVAGVTRCLDNLGEPSRPDEIRWAAYQTGEAMSVLLDLFSPGWTFLLESNDARVLDELLRVAVAGRAPAEFSAGETSAIAERAQADVAALIADRSARREQFVARKGRVVLAADGDPLRVAQFDPMNLRYLGGGEVLHTRLLKLRNESTELEILDAEALTESAGAHPLFDGIRRVTIHDTSG